MYINLVNLDLCPGQGGSSKPETTFSVEPSTTEQAIIPQEGYVFSSGTVAAVDSTIDSNIVPSNIKTGISILGVQGTVNPQKPEEHLVQNITTNGSHTYSPTPGSVYSDATITVAVPMKVEETFNVTPTTSAQTILPESGHVFSSGTVTAVTSEIDANIVPENIRTGVSILGVTGNVSPAKSEETFTVNPSTQAQTITPQSGYTFSSGTVAAVDSTIDQNIVSSNIKDGVEILGVLGTYTGGVTPTGTISIGSNGTYDVTAYASAQVAVGGKDYRNQTGTVTGLADLGWDADSIGYYQANNPHYSWQNSEYAVKQANIDLYGVVNRSNKNNYKTNTDMEYLPMFDTTGVTSMANYFNGFSHIKGIPILDTSSVTNMWNIFQNCSSLITIPLLDTSSVTSMANVFTGCRSLTTIPLLDTSSATDMSSIFSGCSSLTTIPLLDTSNVTNMNNMFYQCSKLTTVPALDMRKVTRMNSIFWECTSLTTVNGIDFSLLTTAPSYFFFNSGYTVTRFIVNGKIDFSWTDDFGLARLTAIDFDSVKSILQAMSRTTNTDAKTMKFNRLIEDQNGELAALVADCQDKGWTIIGLAIPTGDPVIHYTSKDGNIVTPNQLPSGLTVVSNVYQDGVGTITFSGYPSEIWERMYNGRTQLDTIEIPDEVGKIGYAAFADRCGITKITIPSNVTYIRMYAFSGATDLIEVKMESAVPPTIESSVFNGHNANLVIKVPASAVNTYKAASGWSEYASLIVGY